MPKNKQTNKQTNKKKQTKKKTNKNKKENKQTNKQTKNLITRGPRQHRCAIAYCIMHDEVAIQIQEVPSEQCSIAQYLASNSKGIMHGVQLSSRMHSCAAILYVHVEDDLLHQSKMVRSSARNFCTQRGERWRSALKNVSLNLFYFFSPPIFQLSGSVLQGTGYYFQMCAWETYISRFVVA